MGGYPLRSTVRSLLLFVLGASLASAQQPSVAITFDDLPVATTTDPAEARSINNSILKSLDRRGVPAIGFVVENMVQEIGAQAGREILDQWVSRGYDLGNHTFSHISFNKLTVEQFEHEILAGENSLAGALAKSGKRPLYFRFPESHTGDTREKHDAIANFLASRSYRLAACSIDNEDFVFDKAYGRMLASKDKTSAAKLRAVYIGYTAAEVDYYTALHKQVFGREIPHVMVLHVNRLNADVIDQVLELFEERHYRFVSIGEALSDPAYATPDTFVSSYGPMWGYRWAKELGVRVNGNLEKEPPAWVLEYGRRK